MAEKIEQNPEAQANTSDVIEDRGKFYSVFETLYESVLFKKPELITSKVFINAVDELKVMKAKLTDPSLASDLSIVEELLLRLYTRVLFNFNLLDKEPLAKLLINVKDKLQSPQPQEAVKKIGKMIVEYVNTIKKVDERENKK